MKKYETIDLEHGYGHRLVRFQDLMRHRVRNILLVSSLYDSFVLGEDGHLYEMLASEYAGPNMGDMPGLMRVSSGREALELAYRERQCDLVIATMHVEDIDIFDFADQLRRRDAALPLVLLIYDNRELEELRKRGDPSGFDRVFMWQGSFRILPAIIQCVEDQLNVEHDTKLVGVQSIILIEDNIRFYSAYLPIIYAELQRHTRQVTAEGINPAHKLLRLRARPKILLCHTYEEAWDRFLAYHDTVLGVISDFSFSRAGTADAGAGAAFARAVTAAHPDVPILLQSDDPQDERAAGEAGASFLLKNSPLLLRYLRRFMKQYFYFGDFVFRSPDGDELARARNLRELAEQVAAVPDACLLYHAARNHFSNWLKARSEFFLASYIRPLQVTPTTTADYIRSSLLTYLREHRVSQQRGSVVDFSPTSFDPQGSFARVGGGSLGGKGRGLAFAGTLIDDCGLRNRYDGVEISIPPTMILGTDIFDQFLSENNLTDFALSCGRDEELESRFTQATMPAEVEDSLREFLRAATYPLAVRSSSLLEDSQYQPFAGVYATIMAPNCHPDATVRLAELVTAVKRVYASTFTHRAKAYIRGTPFRLEEEKMAVIIQKLAGRRHGGRFYPDFSGVARSHNFYPAPPMKPDDGIVSVAIGLGAMVVDGGPAVRFCPRYPDQTAPPLVSPQAGAYRQETFYALMLPDGAQSASPVDTNVARLDLSVAKKDGVLGRIGLLAVPPGALDAGAKAIPIVDFNSVLQNESFPLPVILSQLMELGRRAMSAPVDIEFSVSLAESLDRAGQFSILQMRPMVLRRPCNEPGLGDYPTGKLLCRSRQVMGEGVLDGIFDLVVVDRERFDRSRTAQIAAEVEQLNRQLSAQARPYLLIGVGRWGSSDDWLGVPVNWDQISGARVIVETGTDDIRVVPSQGTHFFQYLTAFDVGYFTVNSSGSEDFIDWNWLADQTPASTGLFTRYFRFDHPLAVRMNGAASGGIILKPADA